MYLLEEQENEYSTDIPAGYQKTPPYSKSRFVRTYVPTSSTFALLLVADKLLRRIE